MQNTKSHYGLISIFFHWLSAIVIIGLFSLGYYMVDLTYYDTWYKSAPALHKSMGIVLLAVMILRVFWRMKQVTVEYLANHTLVEQKAGKIIHRLLYLLIFFIMISGYLISTADGRGIDVFKILTVPGFGSLIEHQEDIAGVMHQWLAYLLMTLVFFHALAALKHHFIDKDNTLNRMLGKRQSKDKESLNIGE